MNIVIGIILFCLSFVYMSVVRKLLNRPQPPFWCKEGWVADLHTVIITGLSVIGVSMVISSLLAGTPAA